MNDITLDSVLSFNAELLRLTATGLPIELGFDESRETLKESLERISAQLAIDVGRGLAIDKAIASASYLPRQYRTALESWVRCDESTLALDGPVASATARWNLQSSIFASLIQPAIVLCLVFFAFMYLCLATAPKLEAIYAQQFKAPSHSLAFLKIARDWMPIWAPLVSLTLLTAVVWSRYGRSRLRYRWLPGSSTYFDSIRKANYTEHLAKLIERKHSLSEALILAGPLPVDAARVPAIAAATDHLIQSATRGQRVSPDDPAIQAFPSILRWALTGDLEGEPMPSFLRFTARTYRQSAQRQATVWHSWMPAILIALFSGMLVLAFSLSLFMPFIELICDLADQGGT